jgi:hypothetical protein
MQARGPFWRLPVSRIVRALLSLLVATALGSTRPVDAAEVMPADLQVVARALSFVEDLGPGDITLGIVYDAASRGAAEAVATVMRGGLRSGAIVVRPALVDVAELARRSDLKAVFLMPGLAASGAELGRIVRQGRLVSLSTDGSCMSNGCCVLLVRSEPKIEIILNTQLADATATRFSAVFKLIVKRQ